LTVVFTNNKSEVIVIVVA